MIINCKQTKTKLFFLNKVFLVLLTAGVFFFISSSVSFAPTKPVKKVMSDSELSNIDGQSLFNITTYSNINGSNNVIQIDLGIDVNIFSYQYNYKMGYYNGGWDLDTQNFYYGSQDGTTSPLILEGIYMEFGFDNITNNAGRTLNYIEFGSKHVYGNVSGTMSTVSGLFTNQGTGQNSGVLYRQTASGKQVLHFNNDIMGFIFASKYVYTDPEGDVSTVKGIFNLIPNHNTNIST
ncbi:MAG: hypothetical protein ABSC11_00725 [Smithella sp.]